MNSNYIAAYISVAGAVFFIYEDKGIPALGLLLLAIINSIIGGMHEIFKEANERNEYERRRIASLGDNKSSKGPSLSE